MISQLRMLLLLLAATPVLALEPITVLERRELPLERAVSFTHRLVLTLAYLEGGGWAPEAIHAAARETGQILGQCGIALEQAQLVRVGAPARFRDFFTPASRELAHTLALRRPTIYFVSATRQRPPFDAEAIGRGNSRSRPELADTVWVTLATRDLGIALAHELAHVLMDSGEHSEEPGNLMRDETAPASTRLTAEQCARIAGKGSENLLLTPSR